MINTRTALNNRYFWKPSSSQNELDRAAAITPRPEAGVAITAFAATLNRHTILSFYFFFLPLLTLG